MAGDEKKYHKKVGLVISSTEKEVTRIYLDMINRVLKYLPLLNLGVVKGDGVEWESLRKHPRFRRALHNEVLRMARGWEKAIDAGVQKGWGIGEQASDAVVEGFFKGRKAPERIVQGYKPRTEKAREAFLKQARGFYSTNVWKEGERVERHLTESISEALTEGVPATKIAKKIKEDLKYPDKLFRRVRNKHGNLVLSKSARAFHPGRGVYRSSHKNAMRLARTEVNKAYRTADHERVQSLDFVKGIKISLSNNHTCNGVPFTDICDDLAGVYPKEFKFTGWHPQCYSDDSMVLTGRGWKLFKEVKMEDSILSLNPDTLECEWVGITDRQEYYREGDMVRFYNRSLDCLVTPEHEMVYLNKHDGRIERCSAEQFRAGKGAFLRSCLWQGGGDEDVVIGKSCYKLKDFAEFMGYWLSDGSVVRARKSQISIAQHYKDQNRERIIDCIKRMGLTPRAGEQSIYIFNKPLKRYLEQFGKSHEKYIPESIKGASKSIVKVFLDAFLSCDGYERPPKSFIGNRGNVFNGNHNERTYFTTSKQLASDIGELLLKVGSRPSYSIDRTKGKMHKFRNGTYMLNHDLIRISECYSKTATVFKKGLAPYEGYVYDLTLERNHIMYIQRNGKCFWGSNCRCIATTLLEDFDTFLDRKLKGGEAPEGVKELPENFNKWTEKNAKRIQEAEENGTLPHWLRDNFKVRKGGAVTYRPTQKVEEVKRDWLKRNRKNSFTQVKEALIGTTAHHPQIGEIHFTTKGIKEAINQPHKHLYHKNRAIKNVAQLIKNGLYEGSVPSTKVGGEVFHYIETIINGSKSYIVIRQRGKENTFYSIVDKLQKKNKE